MLLTLVIILLAITTAFKTLTLSFLQNNLTGDRIQAINLAREGMEAVRYIRDYNWLYYGNDRRICWNHLEDNDNNGILNDGGDSACTEKGSFGFAENQIGSHVVAPPNLTQMEYILKQNGSHWFLTRKGEGVTTINIGDWASLTKDLITTQEGSLNPKKLGNSSALKTDTSESFRICQDPNTELFTSCLDLAVADKILTKFFRYVHIKYNSNPQNEDDVNVNTLSDGQEVNIMEVIVGVKWVENGILQDVELVTFLSDFYKRTEIDTQN